MNILLDEKGDWAVANGKLQLASGVDEIGQIIATRLRTFAGEWFLNVRLGVPWFSKVFVKNPNPSEVEALLIQTIVESPGVIKLNSMELAIDNKTRKLSVTFSAQTIAGILDFSEVVP